VALSALVVTVTYFGSGFYLNATAKRGYSSVTPATCDTAVTFTVPDSLPANDKDLFCEAFDRFTKEIVDDLKPVYQMNDEAVEWIDKMIRYTCFGGKMSRGLCVLNVVSEYAKSQGRVPSNKERLQACALGWSIEFLQAFFLVADDLMDDSITRRGAPCWYRHPHVKLISVNDSFILESCVYKLLKRYFGSEPYYAALLDLMIEVTRQTELGQLLDLTSQPHEDVAPMDFNRFTEERWASIVKYKTAFYTFYMPVAMGMIMAGCEDKNAYDQAREILCCMGEYFQAQDDKLDCYGTFEQIGKDGTDIQEKKCGWLVVKALKVCNAKQRKIIMDNYGIWDDAKVAKVKKVYRELDLESVFDDYEEETFAKLNGMIGASTGVPKGVYQFMLDKTYKRKK
jgi:farnesyl diphosphate synthase